MKLELMPFQCRARQLSKFFLSATLAQTFNNRSSALTGAAMTTPALAEPFIAAGAAVAFWFFFATEKELSPRGYERNEIIQCLVTPSITKIPGVIIDFLRKFFTRCARVILNGVKEVCYMKGNFVYLLIAAGAAVGFLVLFSYRKR